MSPAEYALQPGTIPFIEPVNPGEQPRQLPAPQMTEANRPHDYSVDIYNEVVGTYVSIVNLYCGIGKLATPYFIHMLLSHPMDFHPASPTSHHCLLFVPSSPPQIIICPVRVVIGSRE
jgi:hypothetical protein